MFYAILTVQAPVILKLKYVTAILTKGQFRTFLFAFGGDETVSEREQFLKERICSRGGGGKFFPVRVGLYSDEDKYENGQVASPKNVPTGCHNFVLFFIIIGLFRNSFILLML